MVEKQSLEASMKAKSSEELANGGASSSAALESANEKLEQAKEYIEYQVSLINEVTEEQAALEGSCRS